MRSRHRDSSSGALQCRWDPHGQNFPQSPQSPRIEPLRTALYHEKGMIRPIADGELQAIIRCVIVEDLSLLASRAPPARSRIEAVIGRFGGNSVSAWGNGGMTILSEARGVKRCARRAAQAVSIMA